MLFYTKSLGTVNAKKELEKICDENAKNEGKGLIKRFFDTELAQLQNN